MYVLMYWSIYKYDYQLPSKTNNYIFDLRLLQKPIKPCVVHSSMNAVDHAKWRDVKTTGAFENNWRFRRFDWMSTVMMTSPLLSYPNIIRLPLMQPVMWSSLQGTREIITKTRLFKYIVNFPTKNWKFSDKNPDTFHMSAQNIDCGYSLELPQCGSSNEYPQSMFLSRYKKNNIYSCKPQFLLYKSGV